MGIQIIKVTVNNDSETGVPTSRTAHFTIQSGTGTMYSWSRSGLPLTGGVQALLDAEEAALYADASSSGNVATAFDISLAEARAWYVANGGAKADVFDKSVAQLHTDITAMVNASFPSASAAVKTGWVRTLMSGLLCTRSYTFEKGLI